VTPPPRRLFLDSGVLVDGCFSQWSASKAILILAAQTAHFIIVLADVVDSEVRAALDAQGHLSTTGGRAAVA